jgi:hypothetical protein
LNKSQKFEFLHEQYIKRGLKNALTQEQKHFFKDRFICKFLAISMLLEHVPGKDPDPGQSNEWLIHNTGKYYGTDCVSKQCCGSGLPDPDFYPSRIPYPKTVTNERGEKNLLSYLF